MCIEILAFVIVPGVSSGGGYTSFPGMAATSDQIGGYQAAQQPFSAAPRAGSIGDYQPPTY